MHKNDEHRTIADMGRAIAKPLRTTAVRNLING